ncbi:MAG: HetP family heterocyst commitment protein [Cyanobacteria bacterium RM1_2_2]|nr:HetP family heterocyst commitment protein [Cyanobacteria bacterium RM1_2_2]
MNSISNNKLDKAMTTEQFTQVVDAILEGKYSWACVLILRFAGYNPLHYIPYRTYNRLMKDNSRDYPKGDHCKAKLFQNQPLSQQDFKKVHQIQDLAYSETLNSSQNLNRGGYAPAYFDAYAYRECFNFKV